MRRGYSETGERIQLRLKRFGHDPTLDGIPAGFQFARSPRPMASSGEEKVDNLPSLFDGTDLPICAALGIARREQLNNRSLRLVALSDETAAGLVGDLYRCLQGNLPNPVVARSQQLWRCRRATRIADRNASPEKILEKSAAMLAARHHMPGWFNQCPVATGLADSHKDKHRAVDLVHVTGETARLVELKWAAHTPAHAAFQVLEYGLAYALARRHKTEFGLEDRLLMRVRDVRLEVLALQAFFEGEDWRPLFATLDRALAGFARRHSNGEWTMSLAARAFPGDFDSVPFENGETARTSCNAPRLTAEGLRVREALCRTAPARAATRDRFLPGIPALDVKRSLDAAPGREIASGKFDSPGSSAALAVNAFGFFLHRPGDLPPLPGCPDKGWPAGSLSLETTVRFPWRGGRHPVLDCLVATSSALVGIESKRYEPWRGAKPARFSDTYWCPVWGERMTGYQRLRDMLRANPRLFAFLDAAQLVKHAFGLRSAVHPPRGHAGLEPILFYIHAEPSHWPGSGRRIDAAAIDGHRKEIARFAHLVEGDEVAFVPCSWRRILDVWRRNDCTEIADHAAAVAARFSP